MPIGSEIITGILGSFLYDAAKRPYRSLVDSIDLRTKVHRSIRGAGMSPSAATKAADKAIANLIRELANGQGEYTENVADFLREVGRSVVPDFVRDLVIAGRDPMAAFPVFDAIYKTFTDLPFESRPLFMSLTASIGIVFESSIKDHGLLEAIRSQSRLLSGRIDIIEAAFGRKADLDHFLDHATFSAARLRIAKAIKDSNSKISVETTEGPKLVDIKRIVIPARLCVTDHRNPTPPESDQMEYASISFENFRKTTHNAVVLGDPGGGKSTLTQFLCYEFARSLIPDDQDDNTQNSDSRLPIKIVLRNLDKRQSKTAHYNILEYIIDDLRVHFHNDRDQTLRFIIQALSSGSAIVLFDGLDEILEIAARQQMAAQLSEFIKTYPACPAFVTSRVVGYRDAPMADDFAAFVLSRFNSREVLRFSTSMIKEVKQATGEHAADQAARFVSQTEFNARDLRQNPLMLGLMVFLFMYKGDVPDNRPEIYRECTILMFQKWDKNRGIDVGLASDFKLLDLFCHLAANIFGHAETEEGVSHDWLYNQVFGFFQGWYSNKAESTRAANKVVDFVTGRAWIMCAAGPGTFKFTHRTFLEYFFARNLVAEAGDVGQLIAVLRPHIVRAEWDVVSHLALQIATFESKPQAERAAEILLSLLDDAETEGDYKRNLLTFMARSLEYLSIPERQLGRFIDRLMTEALAGRAGDDNGLGIAFLIVRNTEKRHRYALRRLNQRVQEAVTGGGRQSRRAIYLAGKRQSPYGSGRYLARAQPGNHAVFRALKPCRDAVRAALHAKVGTLRGARDYAYLYEDGLEEATTIHGASLIADGERGAPLSYQLPVLVAISEFRALSWRKRSDAQLAKAASVIHASHLICNDIIARPEVLTEGRFSKNILNIAVLEVQSTLHSVIDLTPAAVSRFDISDDDQRAVVCVLLAHLIAMSGIVTHNINPWHRRSDTPTRDALETFVMLAKGSNFADLLAQLYAKLVFVDARTGQDAVSQS